jgi:hypothetical protein
MAHPLILYTNTNLLKQISMSSNMTRFVSRATNNYKISYLFNIPYLYCWLRLKSPFMPTFSIINNTE